MRNWGKNLSYFTNCWHLLNSQASLKVGHVRESSSIISSATKGSSALQVYCREVCLPTKKWGEICTSLGWINFYTYPFNKAMAQMLIFLPPFILCPPSSCLTIWRSIGQIVCFHWDYPVWLLNLPETLPTPPCAVGAALGVRALCSHSLLGH